MEHNNPLSSLILGLVILVSGCNGDSHPTGKVEGSALAPAELRLRDKGRKPGAELLRAQSEDKQILFGDLHVHSTYSVDAFTLELPMMGQQS